ncbi:hypothetical protein C0993_000094 [Termitomyces sp. T159_Od127]|nr:hypothetical protein C0993_000094 [Termitomyces sp. T159_Od127]
MPVTTTSTAVHIAPVVVKTFLKHEKRKARKVKEGRSEDDAKDDILYDDTNTHVPSPPWAAVSPVLITLSSCNRAADILIEWFGPHELKYVVGGERWWQVRGLDGVDGEWISEKDYLDLSVELKGHDKKRLSNDDCNILRMDHLETVMLYVHGGGYFWGSINTHRYQIIRYDFYLIEPPHGALHKAISPSKIVMAGDSAGGGLCVTVLTILRDLGLPMPAGAVLISPWVDLTHSFPSVMDNQKMDIIPQHGFLAKPSTLWPLDPLSKGDDRVISIQSDVAQKSEHKVNSRPNHSADNGPNIITPGPGVRNSLKDVSLIGGSDNSSNQVKDTEAKECDSWELRPPKVSMESSTATPLELHAQIQLYATNEQLCHALVSPVLQGSLGNLPPLYILAGNDELLRDEIIYLAHRAAQPSKFPAKQEVLRNVHRQKENSERFTIPTKVHLQVYDGMCHVLTVFTFTESAKCAYRSIAEFVKHVSSNDAGHLEQTPFSQTHRLPVVSHTVKTGYQHRPNKVAGHQVLQLRDDEKKRLRDPLKELKHDKADISAMSDLANEEKFDDLSCKVVNWNVLMIRERVNIRGIRRHMEPPHEIKALRLLPEQVGITKEAPIRRWLEGQRKWDVRFEYVAKKVIKRRVKIEASASRLLENARVHGLLVGNPHHLQRSSTSESKIGVIQEDRRWGPLDLDEERPPPSAIAKRRDTLKHEALALLKKTIYHTAPITHQTVPDLRTTEAIRAVLNPRDDFNKPPQQSVSEQQVHARLIPVHGLRLWDSIIRDLEKAESKEENWGGWGISGIKSK